MWYNGAGGDFLTHLLVVDDEVSILELIKNSLGKDGYLITVCQNADDVDIKKLHFYDLILLGQPHGEVSLSLNRFIALSVASGYFRMVRNRYQPCFP